MTNGTARLSLKEAFDAANTELALSEDSDGTDISSGLAEDSALGEQLAVETPEESGLFSTLAGDEGQVEQPEEDSYEVTVDGERFLVSLSELRSGYMRQADYTRKTQELAEQQRDAEQAIALKAALEERPEATLRLLYQRINAGQSLDFAGVKSQPQVQQNKGLDIEAMVEQRVQDALNSDPRLVQFQQEQALARIESIFSEIESGYGVTLTSDDKRIVLEKSQEMGTTDLEAVFGSLYAKKLKADRERDLAKRNAKQAQPVQGQGMQVEFNPQVASPKKYDSFRSALEEQLALEQEAFSSAP